MSVTSRAGKTPKNQPTKTPLAGFFQNIYKGGSKVKNESEDLTKKESHLNRFRSVFMNFPHELKENLNRVTGVFSKYQEAITGILMH